MQSFSADRAQVLALQALGWMSGKDDLLLVFLGQSGASVDDAKAAAANPEFLAAVLDFLLQSDELITEFCDDCEVAKTDPIAARAALPGGDVMNWT